MKWSDLGRPSNKIRLDGLIIVGEVSAIKISLQNTIHIRFKFLERPNDVISQTWKQSWLASTTRLQSSRLQYRGSSEGRELGFRCGFLMFVP
jgi:hypothetical protein